VSQHLLPGDDFNRRGWDWSQILDGAECVGQNGTERLWRRPGKDTGHSASTGHCTGDDGAELLKVFTSNWPPFEEEGSYSNSRACARLRRGGDLSAAARARAAGGYGDRPPAATAPPADGNWGDRAREHRSALLPEHRAAL